MVEAMSEIPKGQYPGPVKGNDPRAAGYETIARFHKTLMEIKWRANTAGVAAELSPQNIITMTLHCEQAVAFLAEEILRLARVIEERSFQTQQATGD